MHSQPVLSIWILVSALALTVTLAPRMRMMIAMAIMKYEMISARL